MTMMMAIKCAITLFLSLSLSNVLSATTGTIKLISPDGLLMTSDQVKNFMSSKQGMKEIHSTSIIKTYDGESNLFDSSFGVKFGPDDAIHLATDTLQQQVYLSPYFDSLNTKNYFGCKALDFCCSLSNNICVLVSGKEFSQDRVCFDQCIRRIVKDISQESEKKLTLVVDIFGSSLSGPADQKAFEISLESFIKTVTKELDEANSVAPKLQVIFADFKNEESLASLQAALTEVTSSQPLLDASKVASSIHSKWVSLSSEVPKPVYTQEEKKSLFIIESAFAHSLSQIEASVAAWQRRVGGSGRLVGKFADRVRALNRSVQDTYKLKTAGTITIRERNRRLQDLKDIIKQSTTTLFNQQLAIVQSKISSNLKKSLLAIAEPSKESELQALRNALFDFKTAVADLEIEELGLKLTSTVVSEVSSKLQTIATELPESPMAKLAEAKKLEEQAKAPKKKGARGFNVALNLVGMLRPPGFGNLQGYANYATSLLGLPLELLLGFQNDGDSPDVMGEDREYPLLRLQPKVHFDIDL